MRTNKKPVKDPKAASQEVEEKKNQPLVELLEEQTQTQKKGKPKSTQPPSSGKIENAKTPTEKKSCNSLDARRPTHPTHL